MTRIAAFFEPVEVQARVVSAPDADRTVTESWVTQTTVRAAITEQTVSDKALADAGLVDGAQIKVLAPFSPHAQLGNHLVVRGVAYRITSMAIIGRRRRMELTAQRIGDDT